MHAHAKERVKPIAVVNFYAFTPFMYFRVKCYATILCFVRLTHFGELPNSSVYFSLDFLLTVIVNITMYM